jgi:hypothetical protein
VDGLSPSAEHLPDEPIARADVWRFSHTAPRLARSDVENRMTMRLPTCITTRSARRQLPLTSSLASIGVASAATDMSDDAFTGASGWVLITSDFGPVAVA